MPVHEFHLNIHQDNVVNRLVAKRDLITIGKFRNSKLFTRGGTVFINILPQLAAVQRVIFHQRQTDHISHFLIEQIA